MNTMSTDTYIDNIIDTCWERIGGNDSIYVTRVSVLIRELEIELQIPTLFVTSELNLLDQLIRTTPHMRLYKREVKEFLIRLVRYRDFDEFLRERFGLRSLELGRRTQKSYVENIRTSNIDTSNMDPKPRSYMFGSRNENKPFNPLSPPYSPPSRAFPRVAKPDRPSTSSVIQDRRIDELTSEVASLEKYARSLENQVRHQPGSSARRVLDRERTIKNLDKLCYDYQRELRESKKRDEANKLFISQMVEGINKQDQLIEALKSKLSIDQLSKQFEIDDDRPTKLRNFLINLPFLKQYYAYYKYKEDTRHIGLLFLNGLTLLFTTLMITGILQFVLYLTLWIFGSSKTSYVYDDYGSLFSTQSTFAWWKEIEFLEYWVYRVGEWLEE